MKKGLVIVGIVVLILAVVVIGQYNSLVSMETNVDAQWAQVENQFQRRADLIPNLVSTVKGFASHEQEIFQEIAEARSRLLSAQDPQSQMEANNSLDASLGRLLAISENYPTLKADASFIRLQDELAGTENRIAFERKRYNESVEKWNRSIRRFPMVIVANMFGKAPYPYFEASEQAKSVPQVEF
ncbi:MAG: LemA family protein [Limnochordia bacterium]|nr:LemA family protein [Limnochordia bacterium]